MIHRSNPSAPSRAAQNSSLNVPDLATEPAEFTCNRRGANGAGTDQIDRTDPILSAWESVRRGRADCPAVLSATGETLRTFSDIESESREFEEPLSRFPVGSAIAFQIGNDERWPALLLAAIRRGIVPLPLGLHMENGQVDQTLEMCGAAGRIFQKNHATGESVNGSRKADEIVFELREGRAVVHDCDFLKLTSGTTGAPRAIRFKTEQLLADCTNICETMGITCQDLNYGVIPFSHSYGFSNLITPLLCRGVPLVASEERLPRGILSGLEFTGATVFPGMPVFYDKLAAIEGGDLPRLRLCISAGAPLPAAVAERFTRRWGKKVHTFYGSSECGGIGYDASLEVNCRDGYAGLPMHGVTVEPELSDERLADPTSSRRCGASRILVRSKAVGEGYYPQEEPETLGGGRFIPGDLIQMSGAAMTIVGRVSDTINIAGRKLHPCEIEARIAAFPGVRQVVVFGVPSALRGEEPVACIAGSNLDRGAIQRLCQQSLSGWQMPRDFWLVDEIPVNERGKFSRRALAESFSKRT